MSSSHAASRAVLLHDRANSVGEKQQLVIGNVLFSRIHTIRYMYRPNTDNAWNITFALNGVTDLSTLGTCHLAHGRSGTCHAWLL
jgi:hypothetical protein